MGEGREEQRRLRAVDWQEPRALRLGHQAFLRLALRGGVVQRVAAPFQGQAAEHVEVQEVGALDLAWIGNGGLP